MMESEPLGENSRKTFKTHFEEALQESQKREKERVENLKRQSQIGSISSISGRWSSALAAQSEVDKLKAAKRNSFIGKKGLVSSRVSQLEQCVMQARASADQIAFVMRRLSVSSSANRKCSVPMTPTSSSLQDDAFVESESGEETPMQVLCDTTTTCHFDQSSSTYQHLVSILEENKDGPVALACGIYMSDEAQKKVKHPVHVIALAMRDDETAEPCITLTINAPREEYTRLTKIAVFPPSYEEGKDEDECAIWETVLDIYSQKDTELGEKIIPETLPIDEDLNISFDNSEISFGRGRGDYVSDSDSAADEGEGVWLESAPMGDEKNEISYSDIDDFSSLNSSTATTPNKQDALFSFEGGLPEVRNDVGRTVSVNEVERKHFAQKAAEKDLEYSDSNIINMEAEPLLQEENERKSTPIQSCHVKPKCCVANCDINAFDVEQSSCSSSTFVLRNRLDSCTTVITANSGDSETFQFAVVDESSNVAISNNTIVKWSRAVAKSGWLTKWPMQNQKAGFRTKRFFILRDRTLSYHRHEPRTQEEARSDYAMHSIRLKNHYTVGPSRSRLTHCIKLDTGTDKLWFRCKSRRKEKEWIDAIRQGCSRYATPCPIPSNPSQKKVTSIWHHENPKYSCKLVDVTNSIDGYSTIVAALFCCTESASERTYSLQCTTKEKGVELEQLDLMEALHSPQILCMRILDCNVICISGSSGYIGVAVLGEGNKGPLKLKACSVTCRQFEGHSRNSCVSCLAYSSDKKLLVSGDIKGVVSLWKYEGSGALSFLGNIKLQGHDINSISFHPRESCVLVGTYSKLFLVGIWSRHVENDIVYRFEGITLLDECGADSVSCLFSTAFSALPISDDPEAHNDDGKEAQLLTIWKLETSNNLSSNPGYMDGDALYTTEKDDFNDLTVETRNSKHMEEINLTERASLSIDKEKSKVFDSMEEDNSFHSRVYRYEVGEQCLLEAMTNLIPVERSASTAVPADYSRRKGEHEGKQQPTKSYSTSRHYAAEALADMCPNGATGINLLLKQNF